MLKNINVISNIHILEEVKLIYNYLPGGDNNFIGGVVGSIEDIKQTV